MPRRMSCALTIDAVRDRTKTVTRRRADTWQHLAAGDRLTLVEKGMGLPKGARQVVLAEVEVVDVRVEPLGLVDHAELLAEGFRHSLPGEWMAWWAMSHGYRPPEELSTPGELLLWLDGLEVRRIEWRYIDQEARP